MKFQATQKNLNECLKNVSPFADKGHQLDIIKNILLKTSENFLEVAATNLGTSIIEKVPGSCQKQGSITVPASLFRDYIQSLPASEKISLDLEDRKLSVECGSTKAVVHGLSAENYPIFPSNKRKKALLEIKAADFRRQLNQVILAANKDINRPILTGVYLHAHEKDYYMAATDSYRLAETRMSNLLKKTPIKSAETKIIIPASSFQNLERILSGYPTKKLSIFKEEDEKNVLFVIGDGEIEITSSLVEGIYPDYRKLLPEKFDTEIVVKHEDLVNSVKRASLFSQEASHPVVLNWSEKNRLNLKSSTSQIGDNKESIEASIENKSKDEPTIILNAKFLQEVLQVMDSPYIKLNLNSQLNPCLLQECHKDKTLNPDYRHAIMPLKP